MAHTHIREPADRKRWGGEKKSRKKGQRGDDGEKREKVSRRGCSKNKNKSIQHFYNIGTRFRDKLDVKKNE